MKRLVVSAVVALLTVYQRTLSFVLGPRCRFYPSCSSYAQSALERYGLVKGGWMALVRLSRCHPFNPGGFDPVPLAATAPLAGSSGHGHGAGASCGDVHG